MSVAFSKSLTKPSSTSRLRRTTAILASAITLALSISACSSGDNSDADGNSTNGELSGPEAELYEAAKDEGAVTWYSSTPDLNAIDLFEEKYPDISVEFVRLPAGQLATRYLQEEESGASAADMVTIADDEFIDDTKDNWFETDIELPALDGFPDEYFNDGIATVGIAPYGFVYNTDSISSEPPTDWADVLEAEYSGQIMMGDPRGVPGYLRLAYLWKEEYGIEFLEELAAQDFRVQDSGVAVNESIAAGSALVSMNSSYALMSPLAEAGAPLEFSQPSITTGSEFYTGISTNAQHPASAKLLMNFLLTEEAQEVFSADQVSPYGALNEDMADLPEGYKYTPSVEVKEDQDEILEALNLQ